MTSGSTPSIRLRDLETIHALLVGGTTIAAADILGVTQPSISRGLEAAEARLGVKLFDRVRNRLIPTKPALAMAGDLNSLFNLADVVQRRVSVMKTENEIVFIGTPVSLGTLASSAVALAVKQDTGATICLRSLRTSDLISRVAGNHVDLALGYIDWRPEWCDVVCDFGSQIGVLVPEGHPLFGASAYPVSRLASERIIGPNPLSPLGKKLQRATAAIGVIYQPSIEINLSLEAIELCKSLKIPLLIDQINVNCQGTTGLFLLPMAPIVATRIVGIKPRGVPLRPVSERIIGKIVALGGSSVGNTGLLR